MEQKITLGLTPGIVAPLPLALYVHLPWCVRKCPYCDFNSHASSDVPETAYLDALKLDLESALPQIWGRKVHSVFLGGGTPSLFPPDSIDHLLTSIRTLTQLEPMAEITMEANPGTVEAGRFRGYRDAGVTRLSLGIQSFNDDLLAGIGRIHGGREARQAAELAALNFETFNLDLMYALPRQSPMQFRDDLAIALSFDPPHLSCYHLTLEPNTPFGHVPPADLPDDDAAAQLQAELEETLGAAGYEHYETSAFARPRHRCRHNLNYWTFGDYLGIGAGAHSKLSFHDRILRQMRVKHPAQYMQAAAESRQVQEERVLTRTDLPFEFMMNALRLNEGVALELFTQRTGLPVQALSRPLEQAQSKGLITQIDGIVRPTLLGRRFLNDLLALFL